MRLALIEKAPRQRGNAFRRAQKSPLAVRENCMPENDFAILERNGAGGMVTVFRPTPKATVAGRRPSAPLLGSF